MKNKEVLKLLVGFRKFREKYFDAQASIYQKLALGGQSPKTLIIACSDSRVDPAILSSASPGELFVVRNVANLVPPYESTTSGFHGVSAAIEFAVTGLKVLNIVILGHRQCGGIQNLMANKVEDINQPRSFVGQWMSIAKKAKEKVLSKFPDLEFELQCRECELESIQTSIANLRTFPFVQEAILERNLNIIGVYFDLESGQLLEFDEAVGEYKIVFS